MRIRFGPFTIDSETRQLFRESEELHLSPKAFDLLEFLIARRPAVVNKQDLFARIWPHTHVAEANLNVIVGDVRRALADDPRVPRFIRTAHGVGYAFCGEATDLDRADTPQSAPPIRIWLEAGDRTYVLAAGDNTIGRDPRCTVWLNDAGVSRRHARIRTAGTGGTAVIEDLGSTNGTYIGRRKVSGPAPLADGDRLKIGDLELTFRESADRLPATRRVRRPSR